MFSNFTATIKDVVINWNSEAPHLTGNGPAISHLVNEINANALIDLTPTGPRVISVDYDAAVVFTVINKLFGFTNIIYDNPPDISKLWTDPPVPEDISPEMIY